MHQPCGEIVPSTALQADGGWNCLQFSQRWSPFGVSWYFTVFCGVLVVCARATLTPAIDAPAAPAAIVRTRRRETPCCSVMTFHPEMRISRKHGHIYTGQGARLGPCPSHGPALNGLTCPNGTRTAFAGFVPCFLGIPTIFFDNAAEWL